MRDALLRARERNAKGISAIINLLGEHSLDHRVIDEAEREYSLLLNELDAWRLNASISVKPTQLGLGVSRTLFAEKIGSIVKQASSLGRFAWIDMEGSPYTEDTISIYKELLQSYENIGLCIQANMRRSEADVRMLTSLGSKVRICKGAYNENPDIAYKSREEVNGSFSNLMRIVFEAGVGPAVATHDSTLIHEALELCRQHRVDFEIQMLLGVRDNLKSQLAAAGYRVSEYMPYGPEWLPYTLRRIREKKSNIVLAARSILSG